VRLVICLLQTISLDACERWAERLAWFFGDLVKIRRRVLMENLTIAYPSWTDAERKECIRRMWKHLFVMMAEIAQTGRKIHRTNWRNYFQFINLESIMRMLWDDRPKMVVSAHYGNFELASYSLGLFGFKTFAVARTLDNPYLNDIIGTFRGAKGRVIPKEGSANEIASILEQKGTISILADQHAGPKGCWVDFFGKMASTHKAIALFSLGNDAPLGVSFSRRLDRPLHYEMGLQAIADPLSSRMPRDVAFVTQWFTKEFEQMINVDPDQYWWLHRRWKGEPPVRKKLKEKVA
jgi:KDO2-lipid IV(A) lauroyltransferase